MLDIRVTFPPGRKGPLALVRMKEAGQEPEFRVLPLSGPDLEDDMAVLLEFIWAHVQGPHVRQGWLWEA